MHHIDLNWTVEDALMNRLAQEIKAMKDDKLFARVDDHLIVHERCHGVTSTGGSVVLNREDPFIVMYPVWTTSGFGYAVRKTQNNLNADVTFVQASVVHNNMMPSASCCWVLMHCKHERRVLHALPEEATLVEVKRLDTGAYQQIVESDEDEIEELPSSAVRGFRVVAFWMFPDDQVTSLRVATRLVVQHVDTGKFYQTFVTNLSTWLSDQGQHK